MRLLLCMGLLVSMAGGSRALAGEPVTAGGKRQAFVDGVYSVVIPEGWRAEWNDAELSLKLYPPAPMDDELDGGIDRIIVDIPKDTLEAVREAWDKELAEAIDLGEFGPAENVMMKWQGARVGGLPAIRLVLTNPNRKMVTVSVLVKGCLISMEYTASDEPAGLAGAAVMDGIFNSLRVDADALNAALPRLRDKAKKADPDGTGALPPDAEKF